MLRVILVLLLSVSLLKAACPDGLFATHITATSATLHWRNPRHSRRLKRVKDFKVKCAGTRHYIAADGASKTDIDSVVHYVPKILDHILIGNLQPNFNYSCSVTAEGRACARRRSRPHRFLTHYKAPEPPFSPQVERLPNGDVMVLLSPASSEYGPISGYKLQFHVVDSKTPYIDNLPYLPEEVLTPSGPLATLAGAQGSSHPVSFQLSFADQEFPFNITVDDSLLNSALKNGTSYSVVTVAYSNITDEDGSTRRMFSASKPSTPFVAAGRGVQSNKTTKWLRRQRATITTAVVIGVVFPSLVILYASCVGAYIVCKEYRALIDKRDKEDQVFFEALQDEHDQLQLRPLLKETVTVGRSLPQTVTPASEIPSQDPFMNLLDPVEDVPTEEQTDDFESFKSRNTSSDEITVVDVKPTSETLDEQDLLSLSEVTIFCKESVTPAAQDVEIQQHPRQVDSISASGSAKNRRSEEVTSNLYMSATSEVTFHSACDFDTGGAGISIDSEFEKAANVETKDVKTLTAHAEIENLMEFTDVALPHHSGYSQHPSQSLDISIPDEYLQAHNLSTSESEELFYSQLAVPEGGAEVKNVQSLPSDSSDEEQVESDCEAADKSCVDTSEEDRVRAGHQRSRAKVSGGKEARLQSRASSQVFVPRRASSRQYRDLRPHAEQDVDTQQSFVSTHGHLSQNQEHDQAPELEMELEMDLFDFDDTYA